MAVPTGLRDKLLRTAYWIVPCVLCLALYWPGLMAWFQQDDFVWLNLRNQAHGWDAWVRALFQPNAVQGSWRPLSERAYFLALGAVFGTAALPYHIWAFLTQFANLTLAAAITTRLTRSRAAGFWAAILWAANSKLATAMAWPSAYNQLLCGFFLLLAFYLFLRFVESGKRRDYILTWCAFLAGFLAMEANVVFPLLAAAYAGSCARKYWRSTIPFFGASLLYVALHFWLAPNHAPEYQMHIDGAMPGTLWGYWKESFEPTDLRFLSQFWRIFIPVTMAAASTALAVFVARRARRREWLAAVLAAWYFIALAPVAALRDHVMEYYLTLPVLFLAMLAGYAMVNARRKALALTLAAAFLAGSLPAARRRADYYRERSEAQEAIVMGVARAHELHPGKAILLDGVDEDLFNQMIVDHPFLYLGISDVYLAPRPQAGRMADFMMTPEEARRGLASNQIEVYRVGQGPLRNITRAYEVPVETAGAPATMRVNLADAPAAELLGPGWYGPESGFRWMGRKATLRAPWRWKAGQKLYVTAVCPAEQLARGPLPWSVTVDGARLAATFTEAGKPVTFAFELPAATGNETEIRLDVSRTIRIAGDRRELGIAVVRIVIN